MLRAAPRTENPSKPHRLRVRICLDKALTAAGKHTIVWGGVALFRMCSLVSYWARTAQGVCQQGEAFKGAQILRVGPGLAKESS